MKPAKMIARAISFTRMIPFVVSRTDLLYQRTQQLLSHWVEKMAEKKAPDPFPELPRRSLFTNTAGHEPTQSLADRVIVHRDIKPASAATVGPAAKRKRGRPLAPKPWIAEGISRATWNRRKKGAKPLPAATCAENSLSITS